VTARRLVVCWFDPGITTGWAVVRVPIKQLLLLGQVGAVSYMQVSTGQFRGDTTSERVDNALAVTRKAYEELADEEDVMVVGHEGFTLRMLSADPELLEPVRWLAVWDDRFAPPRPEFPLPVERQDPSMMAVIGDDRLRLWGLWQSGREHGRAALKHALVYCRRFSDQKVVRMRAGYEEEDAVAAAKE
jgi:hypothetical protein